MSAPTPRARPRKAGLGAPGSCAPQLGMLASFASVTSEQPGSSDDSSRRHDRRQSRAYAGGGGQHRHRPRRPARMASGDAVRARLSRLLHHPADPRRHRQLLGLQRLRDAAVLHAAQLHRDLRGLPGRSCPISARSSRPICRRRNSASSSGSRRSSSASRSPISSPSTCAPPRRRWCCSSSAPFRSGRRTSSA